MFITGKFHTTGLKRIYAHGTPAELNEVVAITKCKRQSGKVSFHPDYVLLDIIMHKVSNVKLSEPMKEWFNKSIEHENEILDMLEFDSVDRKPLYPYQSKAVSFIKKAKRVIIGDDRGLGKTVEAIKAMEEIGGNALIICPAYLIPQWYGEIIKWTKIFGGNIPKVFALMGSKNQKESILREFEFCEERKILIVSYRTATISTYKDIYCNYEVLIVDEVHRISNSQSQQSKAVNSLAQHSNYVVLMSGSDMFTKNPDTLWHLLNCLDNRRFSSKWNFIYRYVETLRGPWGTELLGPKNLDELGEILKTIRLRRTKEAVGFDLPPKNINYILAPLSKEHTALYKKISEEQVINVDGEKVKKTALSIISYLRQLINYPSSLGYKDYEPKNEIVYNLVRDITVEGNKVVVVVWHRDFGRMLADHLRSLEKVIYVDGETPVVLRDKAIQEFSGDTNIMVATLKSIGEGRNLDFCHNVIMAEQDWNPAVNEQAIDRCHRVTSKYPVNVYKIIGHSDDIITIDEAIESTAKEKSKKISMMNVIFKMKQERND